MAAGTAVRTCATQSRRLIRPRRLIRSQWPAVTILRHADFRKLPGMAAPLHSRRTSSREFCPNLYVVWLRAIRLCVCGTDFAREPGADRFALRIAAAVAILGGTFRSTRGKTTMSESNVLLCLRAIAADHGARCDRSWRKTTCRPPSRIEACWRSISSRQSSNSFPAPLAAALSREELQRDEMPHRARRRRADPGRIDAHPVAGKLFRLGARPMACGDGPRAPADDFFPADRRMPQSGQVFAYECLLRGASRPTANSFRPIGSTRRPATPASSILSIMPRNDAHRIGGPIRA